jgi:hypothetical protein
LTLDWTFSFLSVKPEIRHKPEILQVYSYRDGKLQMTAIHVDLGILEQLQPLMILISYIAFFPERDFVKIKLRTSGTREYAVHFLDKRFINRDVLGVLSVTEFNLAPNEQPFEHWGYEETMAEYIFEYYFDLLKNPDHAQELNEFPKWINDQVADFYLDWMEDKRNRPAETLRQLSTSEKSLSQMDQTWDIQLLNEYGGPITELLSFIDNNAFVYSDENETMVQNLTSMSLTALKMLIDQQGGWNIEYLKGKLANEMGFQYTFFLKFLIKNVRYLLVMNSSLYDPVNEQCLQIFRGNELRLLEHIAGHIKLYADYFTEEGQLVSPEHQSNLQKFILDGVKRFWSD